MPAMKLKNDICTKYSEKEEFILVIGFFFSTKIVQTSHRLHFPMKCFV